jgi:hypothetical protein
MTAPVLAVLRVTIGPLTAAATLRRKQATAAVLLQICGLVHLEEVEYSLASAVRIRRSRSRPSPLFKANKSRVKNDPTGLRQDFSLSAYPLVPLFGVLNASYVVLELVELLTPVPLLQLLPELVVILPRCIVALVLLRLDLVLGHVSRAHVGSMHGVQLLLLVVQVIDPGDDVGAAAGLVVGLLHATPLLLHLHLALLLVQRERPVSVHDGLGALVLVHALLVVPRLARLLGHLLARVRVDQRRSTARLAPLLTLFIFPD